MASKLLQLIALATFAILAISNGPQSANALTVHQSGIYHRHALMAKRQTPPRRCKPRPTSSSSGSLSSTSPSSTSTRPPSSSSAPTSSHAPAPTSSQAPPPPSSPPPGGPKVGMAWPNGNDYNSLRSFKTAKVGPIYTWSPYIPDNARALGYRPIPMLWGWKQTGAFQQLVKGGYAREVLGPNEPDHGDQSAMSPGSCIDLWRTYIQPLKGQGYTLISPAVTSAPSGKQWLTQFINGCTGCNIDAIAVHWYGTDAQAFIAYLQDFHNTFNRPIYVTEYACQNFGGGAQCNADQVWSFTRTVTNFMDSTPWIVAYFPFGAMKDMVGVNPLNQLMKGDGTPTALGYEYIN